MTNVNESSAKLNENLEALKHNFLFRGYYRRLEREREKNKKSSLKRDLLRNHKTVDYDYGRKARGYSKPHHLDFENNGVINPGIYQDGYRTYFVPSGTRRK
jgi:hypothetical protein